ncbi:probable calcium-binding protein CML29 [Momordica charantia]|uniref:Probable calcium-binding protein CML29 n=1 Tax=Momordica charantia TaxID=3673 RepID=A0A6J1CMA3_MOMCH|nr:probable calcium-binding protein CML29 [Momordica charantia]
MAQAGSLSAETESLSHMFSLIEAFRAFDADNDGLITAPEVGGIMGSLGYNLSEEDVNLMMEEGDVDKDGLLSMGEFLEMNARSVEVGEVMGSYLKIAYEALKADGDDLVSGEELYDVFLNVGLEVSVEDCNAIVASMDGDEDGAVFLEDLKLIVDSLHPNSNPQL